MTIISMSTKLIGVILYLRRKKQQILLPAGLSDAEVTVLIHVDAELSG